MSLRIFDDRYWPIRRHDRNYCDPSWDLGLWGGYGVPRPFWEERMREKQRQMASLGRVEDARKDAEDQLESVLRAFTQLVPTLPSQGGRNPIEKMGLENPYVTDKDGNRKLQLHFDVRQFKPEEINVKTEGGQLIVHARHEEESDNAHVFREYRRSYVMPQELEPNKLSSLLSPEGVLTIEAPLPPVEPPKEKADVHIPIAHK